MINLWLGPIPALSLSELMDADIYVDALESARTALVNATRVADSRMEPTTYALRLALHQAMAALNELLAIYVPPEVEIEESPKN